MQNYMCVKCRNKIIFKIEQQFKPFNKIILASLNLTANVRTLCHCITTADDQSSGLMAIVPKTKTLFGFDVD